MTTSITEFSEDVSLRKQNETDAEDGEKKRREEEKENESDSEDEDDLVNPDEDVNELLRRAASSYEYRVKYYEELIHETVTEFERGMKRAHVDELSVLINEATDETKQMQNVCHTIMRSLGKLIPIIYQSIEILEYQVKADTEHLCSLEKGSDALANEENQTDESESQLNDQELKEKLGQVKLLTSIDKIEKRLIKGPVPPKVQNAIKKARKLGNSLVQFLEQSKNIRAMFKETQTEVDHTAIINYLAQASARTTENSQNLASYYAKQTVEEVKEVNVQTSRQVTRLKTELMERTKTNLNLSQIDGTDAKEEPGEEIAVDGSATVNQNEGNVEDSAKVEERKATAKESKKDKKKEKGGGASGKDAKKPPAKGQGKKAPAKKDKNEPKAKSAEEVPPEPVVDAPADENATEEAKTEEEIARESAIEEFSRGLSDQLDTHSKLSRRLAEMHSRVRQIKEEIKSADKVFVKFATRDRQNLEDLVYQAMDDVLASCESVLVKHTTCSINLGTLMDAIEEGFESKDMVDNHLELNELVQTAHNDASLSLAEIGELAAETEEYYDYFMLVKCVWEVEIPTGIVFEARIKVSNLRDLTYRVQFNRKELLKVSDTLLKEVDLHEWSELIEIQVLGAPAKEVERIVSAIDKHTYSNESLVLKALADIDRLNRSSGLQKVEPLEDIQNFLPEVEYRYVQTRSLLNNIHRLMVECKQNVLKLMDDPSKKWNLVKLPFNDNVSSDQSRPRPVAVIRAPEECMHLVTSSLDVSMKHAWEKNAVCANELLVSEIVYFPNPPELPCNILLGIPHGVMNIDSSGEKLKLKQTLDGASWSDCETYKDHLFYAYPDHKQLIPSSMVFAELKTDELALAYCVVMEYTDGRDWGKTGPVLFTDSKKVFREGGKISATRDKYSHLIVPKDSFAFLSSVTVKSIKPGEMVEKELKQKYNGLSAMSALYTIYTGAPTVSPFTRFTLQIPFPQEVYDVRRPSTARVTVLAFEKNVQQWVLLTNAGRDSDVIEVRGGMCFINVNPNNVQKVMVVNGPCENVYNIPEDLEMLVAKLPRKPYSDDEVLDEHCLRQIVDRLLMEFDRFAIVLGISNQFRNKAKVSRKTNVSQQKFEILKEWRRKNIDSGELVPRMLKALRSELVSRYDIADWLEEVLRKERQTYESNREKYQHVQPATHRRDYLFSPATVATDEAPFALSRVVEEPVTSRNNSRGLSDLSSEKDDDGEQSDVEGEQTFSAEQTADNEERNESRGHQLAPHEQSKENTGVVHDNHSHPLELLSKQKTEVVFATQDINREAFYRNKSFDNFT